MVSRLFRHTFTVDEVYMPIFVAAYKAILANAAYNYPADIDQIIEEGGGTRTMGQIYDFLMKRETPLKEMASVREQLRARKPQDRRFSTNLHRRMITVLDWEEREFRSVLALRGIDPHDVSPGASAQYGKLSRRSHRISESVDSYENKIKTELNQIYNQFPDTRAYLAPIFEPS